MNAPKRHHHLPESYLEGFCKQGVLYVYDGKRSQLRPQTPKNTAVRGHYYTVEAADGSKRTDIEELLAKIEGQATPVLRKLVSGQPIDQSEKDIFSAYLAFMQSRGPQFEEMVATAHRRVAKVAADLAFKDEKRAEQALRSFEADTGKQSGVSAAALVDFHKRAAYKIEVPRNASLHAMLSVTEPIGRVLSQLDWLVCHAPRSSAFITSDAPLAILPPKNHPRFLGTGVATPGAAKLFSLSSRGCLVMYEPGGRLEHRNVGTSQVRDLNLAVALRADTMLIGESEPQMKGIVDRICSAVASDSSKACERYSFLGKCSDGIICEVPDLQGAGLDL